jgi:aminoglycoside phosphotransferase (APT) family kinase protein
MRTPPASGWPGEPAVGLAACSSFELNWGMTKDNGDIRGIRAEPVSAWLAANIDGATAPFTFEVIVGGHSNLTYRATDANGTRFVVRRPPLGAVLATAHDMGREHKIITGVGRTDVPVPRALGLCTDESVNDAPFYVMNFVEGHVLETAALTRKVLPEEGDRAALGQCVIDTLVKLHQVDPDDVGLGDLGRKEAYLDRQLKRWRGQWEKSKTRELPAMEETYELLLAAKPDQKFTGIVHGDYRLGNMLSGADSQLKAVLDWELCTLGDTLADVGYIMNNWAQPDDANQASAAGDAISATAAGGFPTREEFVRAYAEQMGHEVENVDYYRSFQYWRLAAIVEGVLARYLKGVMANKGDTGTFKKRIDYLAESALQLVRSLG